jgi:transposase
MSRVRISPDQLPDEPEALKPIIAAMAQDAIAAQAEIAKLRFQLARYRRAEFGRSSEKLAREAEQLELAIEALESDQAERVAAASPVIAAVIETAIEGQKPARHPLPEYLPREDVVHAAPCVCPTCGGALRRIGEEITETLDYMPGRFKVMRHVREKRSCRACDTVVAAPAPDHAIARGRAGAGLLAHIVVSKYDDHLPLYRQSEIFAREGVNLETSTLSGWVGATAAALNPLIDALAADVMASDTLHVDDTPVPVLAPGTGKTKTGRLWVYVRDERPFAGARPPAALFFYSPDRKGEHPRAHLKAFRGIIHADGYAGFNELFASNRILEAACWHTSGASSSTCTSRTARQSPRRRSTASASSMGSRRRSRASYPITDDENARSDRSRWRRHWPPGPRRPGASCRENPSSPPPSATCGRAGPR